MVWCSHSLVPFGRLFVGATLLTFFDPSLHNCIPAAKTSKQIEVPYPKHSSMVVLGDIALVSNNKLANPGALIVVWQGMKCPIFEILSTTTRIALNPSHSGNSTTQSIDMSSHGLFGKGKGQRTATFKCLDLCNHRQLWQFHT